MAFNIGINVVEVDGSAAPAIVAAPISIAGFLVRSERGIPNLPVHILGLTDYSNNFGGDVGDFYGSHAVRGFFDNDGTEAYVVRIVGSGTSPAEVTLDDRAAVGTLLVQAGMRGREDPGEWGDALSVEVIDHPRGTSAIPAQIIGSAAEPFALTDGNTLEITVNGSTTPVTITFATADFANINEASAAEVADLINRQTTAVRAGVTPGQHLVLLSATPGTTSRLEIAGTDAAALGFTGPTADSAGGLGTGTTLAVLQSTGGFLPSSAVRLETRGHVIALNAMAASTTDGAGIEVTADGGSPVTVTFTASDFVGGEGAITPGEVVAAINSQAQGFTAALTDDNRLVLMSNTYGSGSSISIAAGAIDATADLGLETRGRVIALNAMATSTTNGAGIEVTADGSPVTVTFTDSDFVGGVAAITPGEVVVAINSQAQGFTAALTADNRLMLISNTYGPSSSITIAPEAIDATEDLGLDNTISPPTISSPEGGVREYGELNAVSEAYRFVTFTSGLSTDVPANVARIQSIEFDLVVNQNGTEVERFESLSMQGGLEYSVEAVINDQDSGSRFITVSDAGSGSGVGQNAPAVGGPFPLIDGNNGSTPTDTDYIGDSAQRTGLYAFDTVDIQLLACPETTSAGVVSASLTYCESRGDAMFVGTAPQGYDLEGIQTYVSTFRARKVYGAFYSPWIQVINPLDTNGNNPHLWIPPVGHILGVYARTGEARGVWKAPAGDEAQLRNALGVEFDMTDTDHTNLVKNGSVNGIRAIPGSGIIVDASRTLSTDTRWLFVNVRRLFNFVKVSLRDGLRWVAQEPHDEALRRRVKFNTITPFLLGLWRQGAFGSEPPEQVFTVKCDTENNPPEEVNQGNFTVEVYFYAVRPAETIIIIVGQQQSGATASEA